MEITKYNQLNKYEASSFTIWKGETRDKNGIGNSCIFEGSQLNTTLKELNENYIFIALNPSNNVVRNDDLSFHNSAYNSKDYKLCYALKGTKYWGSYITDIFKGYFETDSNMIEDYIKNNPSKVEEDIKILNEQIGLIKPERIIVLGNKTYKYAQEYLNDYKDIMITIPHYSDYSHYGNKDKYRNKVIEILDKYKKPYEKYNR